MNRVRVQIMFDKEDPLSVSRTQQHYAKEADINNIMRRYSKTGLLVDPSVVSSRVPRFGDFSDIQDFQTISNRIREAENAFMALPSDVRSKFENDVSKVLDFVADEKNAEEARKLGLLPTLPKDEVPAVPAENPAPTGA